MRFSTVVAALLPVGAALAAEHVVNVGGGSLTFNPTQLTGVQDGDVVKFQFLDKNHTVTQSTFAAPCSNITDANGLVTGVDSGYQAVATDAQQFPVWSITINNASAPLWFYCRQGKHCQAGMVFAVNPTEAKSFDAFKTAAAASTAVNGSPAAGSTTGGTGTTGTTGANGTSVSGGTGVNANSTVAGTTPSPSATGTTGAGANGASSLRFNAGAAFVSLVGLSLGLLL